ncbi:MAG: S46 family peptidase, partial [Ignavibacteria bacterium]|nr:S46 family peptidase [Ignavibacteria bacterium]
VSTYAQEGMWLLNQIDQLDLKKKGLQIETSKIYSKDKPALYNAIVQIGGGTGSFVSSNGLVVTNHHVAFTALQRTSSVEHDYLTNGFLAKTNKEEIQAPGYTAYALLEMKDVTKEILAASKNAKNAEEQDKLINKKIAEMTDGISKGKEDISATIADMFYGKQYYLFIYRKFEDVRLVFSPPMAIGNYGGEIDNWMWPRHTGDFSFLRVYAAPDGSGRKYNPENVPYKPKVWLKVSNGNLNEGDFTFILGFPGFTTRYRTSTSVDWNLNKNYPFTIKNFKEIISLLEDVSKNDAAGKIKVANLIKGLANTMKNYEGKVHGMKKTNFLDKKLEFEKDFMQWVVSNPERKQKYTDVLAKEKEQYTVIARTKERDDVLGNLGGLAGVQISTAVQIYNFRKELDKPETERQPGISEDDIAGAVDGLKYSYNDYYEPAEKALFVRTLKMAQELPANQRIEQIDKWLSSKSGSIEQLVDKAVKSSGLNNVEFASELFKKSSKELESIDDPFMKLAAALYPLNQEVTKINLNFNAQVQPLRKIYLDGVYEWKGNTMYPDANSTMRFTYGNVRGYKPADAVLYSPFTSLKGVVEKNTNEEPFNAPQGLVDLYNKKDFGKWIDPELKNVPVAFTHLGDITGGNSGSPVLNAKGELIGLAFDGNYEAMISDWQFDYDIQRTISVDIRYVLFITEKFSGAKFILDEMGIK